MSNFIVSTETQEITVVQPASGKCYVVVNIIENELRQCYLCDGVTRTTTAMFFSRLGDLAAATQGQMLDVLEQLPLDSIYEELLEMDAKGKCVASDEVAYLLENLVDGNFKNRVIQFLNSL